MAIVGHILLWFLAVCGAVFIVAIVVEAVTDNGEKPEVQPPRPPVQITHLRTISQPAPKVDPNQAQVLQKTTMQITTTKYVDPSAVPPKELTA